VTKATPTALAGAVPDVMQAAVLLEPGRIEVQRCPVPEPGPDDVLVRVAAVGVCGSDAHYYREGRIGDHVVTAPIVLGHEASGVVAAVGAGVSPDRVGQRVSIEPQRPDWSTDESRRGLYNLCPHMRFYATPPIGGALCDYVTIGSAFAHPVHDDISDDDAALFEPLSVAIAAVRKADVTGGSHVLVTGAGPVGLLTAQVARAFGATEVTVSDVVEGRRARAADFGATGVLDPIVDDVTALRVDALIDASGAPSAIALGIRAVAPAGRVVLVGLGHPEISLPVSVIQEHELILTGVFRYANTWPTALELVSTGAVDLGALVTGHFGLDQVAEALDHDRDPGAVKAVVTLTPTATPLEQL